MQLNCTKDRYDPLLSNAVQSIVGGLTLTGAMYLHMGKQLPYKEGCFNSFTNKYFTIFDLLSNFCSIGIGGCRTTGKDHTSYSKDLKIPFGADTQVEYHITIGSADKEVGTLL